MESNAHSEALYTGYMGATGLVLSSLTASIEMEIIPKCTEEKKRILREMCNYSKYRGSWEI